MATTSASTRPNDMKTQRRLLALAVGLFSVWIAYLAFLALTASRPTVLSHPQFMVADLWVIADVDDLGKPVKVREVAYARDKVEPPKEGEMIEVQNLADCKNDWKGSGAYILPLIVDARGYRVPMVPRNPGYDPYYDPLEKQHREPEYHIYPDKADTRGQLDRLPKPKKE
jgi:hypothetical protein